LIRASTVKILPLDSEAEHLEAEERDTLSPRERVTALFEEARADVYAYLLTLRLGEAEAQEVTQEVFLRLYTVMRRGDNIVNGRAWVFRVAHNLGLQSLKRTSARAALTPELEQQLPSQDEGPEKKLIETEKQARLKDALGRLSPQQRMCLHLRAEGLKYSDIASILGVRSSTVGEFLSRALVKLRRSVHE